ncbi:23S rRNA (adenine(2503)-C(2))-methyltransferase RlmN [Fusibacter sp. JL216-2]|uniref:23S rRNA (adenine(2503)-C(2))-methyltransferase RlmN n=1 Tax=Fusibacter sp. JL216-2 TaxID=3071453 RepID=UPI003D3314B7
MKTQLRSLELDDLKIWLSEQGEKPFRAKQIFEWVQKGITSFDQMTNISKALRLKMDEAFLLDNVNIVKYLDSKDKTRKYLLSMNDGEVIEAVLMRYKHGNSICVSTQVGCKMGCTFCASTLGGMTRNLEAGEILGQIMTIQNDIGERISNVVLMGSGEPLDNYDEVLKFLRLVNHPQGLNISMRHITLSTCGLVKEIDRLAEEKLQITLAISLHAVTDEKRSSLMPINRKYDLDTLLKACRNYTDKTGRRITFEYALIEGENDHQEEARQLAKKLRGMLCHVNLIPINPVEERGYKASSNKNITKFQKILKDSGVETTIRRELGSDINAACGQLRAQHLEEEK